VVRDGRKNAQKSDRTSGERWYALVRTLSVVNRRSISLRRYLIFLGVFACSAAVDVARIVNFSDIHYFWAEGNSRHPLLRPLQISLYLFCHFHPLRETCLNGGESALSERLEFHQLPCFSVELAGSGGLVRICNSELQHFVKRTEG